MLLFNLYLESPFPSARIPTVKMHQLLQFCFVFLVCNFISYKPVHAPIDYVLHRLLFTPFCLWSNSCSNNICQSHSNWHESVKPSESLVIIMHSLKALTYIALRKSMLSFCHGKLDDSRAKHLSLHRLKRFCMQANQTTTHTTLTKHIINQHTPVNLSKMTKSKWQSCSETVS